MGPPPTMAAPTPAVTGAAQEAPKAPVASTHAAAAPSQAAARPQAAAPCIKAVQDPSMDCMMDLSMDDIQKLFEDSDEPSAAMTALHAAVGSPDSSHYPRAGSPSASFGSTNTNAGAPSPHAGSPDLDCSAGAARPPSAGPSASILPRDSSFSDLDFDHLISVPNCPVADSCKLAALGAQAAGAPPGCGDKGCGRQQEAARKLCAGGGVRKQSSRLRDKGLAGRAVQDAIEAVGDYLDSEEPADWEAMLFPMALDSEPYGLPA